MKKPINTSSTIHNKNRHLITMKKILILTTAIAMITGVAFAYYLYHKPHQSVSNETPAFTLDATSLVSEYDSNEKKANTSVPAIKPSMTEVVTWLTAYWLR